jgi:hypothetical protein
VVSSPFVLQVNNTLYDLRRVVTWWPFDPQVSPTQVWVRFQDLDRPVQFNKTDFEAAMQDCLDAGGA